MADKADLFHHLWQLFAADAPQPVAEYRFNPKRRWRLDAAFVSHKIAIEIEGGVYSNGRHTRSTGFIRDIEKYNALTLAGWALLRYTPQDLSDRPLQVIEEIRGLLEARSVH